MFDIRYGHVLELNRLEICTKNKGVAFVSRTAHEATVAAYVRSNPDIKLAKIGKLTYALSSENRLLSTFPQEHPVYTAYHIAILMPRHKTSKKTLIPYRLLIFKNR